MTSAPLPPALVIGGPTASGKSGLALRLALELGGTVINADSMQVYGGIPILSAQPSAAEQEAVPHRLYGVLDPDEVCSAARWQGMATAAMHEAWDQGRLPILVGGTGLYLRSLMQGLSPIPEIPETVRSEVRALMAEIGPEPFHARLAARDPVMAARLKPGDSQRLARAWEVLDATGRSLALWQAEPPQGFVPARWFCLRLEPERVHLHAACDGRFDAMLAQGALAEAAAMAARRLPPDRPALKALGLPQLIEHLEGLLSLPEATEAAKQSTRRYAKRQGTWFRHQFPADITVVEQFSESLIATIFLKIRQRLLTPAI